MTSISLGLSLFKEPEIALEVLVFFFSLWSGGLKSDSINRFKRLMAADYLDGSAFVSFYSFYFVILNN